MSTILVIDDQATNRQVLSRLAAQADESADVRSFADPREALESVTEITPDLVVTDYKMPGMDEALESVTEITPDLVVTDYKMPGMDGAEFFANGRFASMFPLSS